MLRTIQALLTCWLSMPSTSRWIAAGADDVEQARELAAQPGAAVVLVGDGVDAQAAHGRVDGLFRVRAAQAVQGLRQRVGPTPDADPQRARVGAFKLAQQQL
jgi:hypothetical protein